jgi:hypothetical protein
MAKLIKGNHPKKEILDSMKIKMLINTLVLNPGSLGKSYSKNCSMKKLIPFFTTLFLITSVVSEAQYIGGGMFFGPRPRYRRENANARPLPKFKPAFHLSAGFGFPNLDKYQLAQFYNAYQGSASQSGVFMGSFDYQFSRFMGIGLMGSYGKVTAPYYDYSSSTTVPTFTGTLENWSIMLNLMNYIPTYNRNITPYIRTAIGVNNWNQNYVDATGAKVAIAGNPSDLAYQVSFGSRFYFTDNASFFAEAGYGKYILSAGLFFKF